MHHAAKDSPMRLFVLFLMRQKQGVDPRDVFILLENNSINNNKSLSSQGDASHRSTRYCRTSIAFKLLGATSVQWCCAKKREYRVVTELRCIPSESLKFDNT